MHHTSPCWFPVAAVLATGCLPPLPRSISDTDGTTGATTHGGTTDATDTTHATTADTAGESTGDPPQGCPTIDPLTHPDDDPNVVANCAVRAAFDPTVARGLSDLRARAGSDENLLFSNEASALLRYTGVTQWMFNASWPPDGMAAAPTVLANGPAVYRVLIPWSASGGAQMGVEGESIYTVVADGRIFRDEFVDVLESTGDWLFAYNVLRADALSDVQWGGDTEGHFAVEPVGVLGATNEVVGADLYFCAYNQDSGDTVGLAAYQDPSSTWAGTRLSRSQYVVDQGETTSIGLHADWLRMTAGTIPAGEYFGEMMMHVGTPGVDDPCTATESLYRSYRSPGWLDVNPNDGYVLNAKVGDESDMDGFSQGGGFYTLGVNIPLEGVPASVTFTLREAGEGHGTLLVHLTALANYTIPSVEVGGSALTDGEFLTQVTDYEQVDAGLEPGQFVLIGVPVATDQVVTIHYE